MIEESQHVELLMAALLPLVPARQGIGIPAGGIGEKRIAAAREAALSLVAGNRKLEAAELEAEEAKAAAKKGPKKTTG